MVAGHVRSVLVGVLVALIVVVPRVAKKEVVGQVFVLVGIFVARFVEQLLGQLLGQLAVKVSELRMLELVERSEKRFVPEVIVHVVAPRRVVVLVRVQMTLIARLTSARPVPPDMAEAQSPVLIGHPRVPSPDVPQEGALGEFRTESHHFVSAPTYPLKPPCPLHPLELLKPLVFPSVHPTVSRSPPVHRQPSAILPSSHFPWDHLRPSLGVLVAWVVQALRLRAAILEIPVPQG
jgi:hypothetical protein